MTKEELESKFEDCFDDNTRSSEGGYGPDVTDKYKMWLVFEPVISEYAKQQVILFIKSSIQAYILHPTTDETVCVDGFEFAHPAFDKAVSDRYDQFIEQQNK